MKYGVKCHNMAWTILFVNISIYPLLPKPPVYGKRFSPWPRYLEKKSYGTFITKRNFRHDHIRDLIIISCINPPSDQPGHINHHWVSLTQGHIQIDVPGLALCVVYPVSLISQQVDSFSKDTIASKASKMHCILSIHSKMDKKFQKMSWVLSNHQKCHKKEHFFFTSASSPSTAATISPHTASVGETMKSMKPG